MVGVDAGASETTAVEALVRMVRDLADVRDVQQAQVSAVLVRCLRPPKAAAALVLAERLVAQESRMAMFVTEGRSICEVGKRVGSSDTTDKDRMSNIPSKIRAHRRSEIICHVLAFRVRDGRRSRWVPGDARRLWNWAAHGLPLPA